MLSRNKMRLLRRSELLAMTRVHGLLPSTAETGSRDRCLNQTT